MKIRFLLSNVVLAVTLVGCGGGGGDSSNPPAAYTVTATISGLAGSGLVLLNNGANNLAVSGNGTATFTNAVTTGTAYNVTVGTQPSNPSQTCVPSNNTGTVNGANVTTITVTCTTNTYTVGGTITGLSGTGMVLENNYGNAITPIGGAFTFATPVASNGTYEVTVASAPSIPQQLCKVTNGTGTVTSANITNVAINCVTQVTRYAFSLNYYGGSLSIYNVDSSTGQPRIRGYAKLGQTPIMGVTDSTGTFSYILSTGAQLSPPSLPVLSATNSYITAFRNDPLTGAKIPVPGSPFLITGTLGGFSRLSIHPNGKFLYVTDDSGANKIWMFAIDSVTGALTGPTGISFNGTPSIVSFNSQGTFAFVSSRTNNEIDVFSVDANTGALTEIPANRVTTGRNPYGFGLHPNGRFAFVTNLDDSTVSVYSIDNSTGKLTAAPNSPFALGSTAAPDVQMIHPSGKFVYFRTKVSASVPGGIVGFAINPATGSLTSTPGSPYTIGVNSSSNLFNGMHPNGKLLYVANDGPGSGSPGSITAFSIDTSTGALSPLAGIPSMNPTPYSLSVEPSGKFLYAASVTSDQILSYSIDTTTGALTPLTRGAVIRAGAEPITMQAFGALTTTTPAVFKSKSVYVANANDNTISNYKINSATGALTALTSTVAGGTAPTNVATSQGSSVAFTAHDMASGTASGYTIDQVTGALTLITPNGTQPVGISPASIAADPTGRFVYTADSGSSTVTWYTIDTVSGAISGPGSISTVTAPLVVAVDPTGRNLFVMSSSQIQVFWIDNSNGSLSTPPVVPPTPPPGVFGTGITALGAAGAVQFCIDPKGKFLYLVNPTTGTIEIYPVSVYGGVLGSRMVLSTSKTNKSITIDPTGQFAYTADDTAGTISGYTINQSNGTLTPFITSPTVTPAANAQFVAVDYSGKFLYAVLANNTIATYSIDQNSGALTLVAGGGGTTGSGPGPITTVGEVE